MELTIFRHNMVHCFVLSRMLPYAAIWSQLHQRRTRKPIKIDRTLSRTWPLSCGSSRRKEEHGRRRTKKERKKKKRRSRGEARFTGDVSRRPPFPCTREFNRGWNVLHLLRVSLLRIAISIPIDAVISAISDADRSGKRRVVQGVDCTALCSLSESENLIIRRSFDLPRFPLFSFLLFGFLSACIKRFL